MEHRTQLILHLVQVLIEIEAVLDEGPVNCGNDLLLIKGKFRAFTKIILDGARPFD
jgi:hypothetical protein